MSKVSDYTDPELDELEPIRRRVKPRETKMTDQTAAPGAEPETKLVKMTGPVNIKGVNYNQGDEVELTEEEIATLTALKAPIEGVEPQTEEEVQAAHDAGVEAQKAKIEENEKAEKEAAEAKH